VGGNPPQTQKPRSQGAWPLNPAEVRGAKRCLGPGGPLRARRRTGARPEQVGAAGPSGSPHRVGLRVPAEPTHLLAQVGLRVPAGPTHLLAQQLGKQGFFIEKNC
jgi:hypothetical protein